MVIIDTKIDKQYKGRIGDVLDLLRAGEIDEIITYGEHFQCLKHEDEEISKRILAKSLASFAKTSIKYIIVGLSSSTSERKCYSSFGTFTTDFKSARYLATEEAAQRLLERISSTKKIKGITRDSLKVEQYLYHEAKHCKLRIYYNITGAFTDYGVLSFIREQVKCGAVPSRTDKRGKQYVNLEDLVIYKDTEVTFTSLQNVKYTRKFDLKLLLHDCLISFNVINDFVERHPEFDVPLLAHMARRDTANDTKFYDLGAVFYTDEAIQKAAVEELCLGSWLGDETNG